MNPDDFPEIIPAHECGHVVALAAAGLANEFKEVTIVQQGNALAVTKRSGASLIKLSGELLEYQDRIDAAMDEAQLKRVSAEYNAFIKEKLPDVCLPHLCFFFGGGALDRLFGRENADRNSIDADCIRKKVMPAMVLQTLSDEDLREVQGKVDKFLFPVFEGNEPLFRKIYDSLVERNTLTRYDLGMDIRREMNECAERSKEGYEELLAWFRQWHSDHRLNF